MKTIDLTGKTALITGGAGGIGRACAETLSEAGTSVLISDINKEGAERVADEVGGTAYICDMGSKKSIVATTEKILREHSVVDMIVNCAGILSYRKGLKAVEFEEWCKVIDVNLGGSFLLCRELIEPMKKAGWGRVIHLSSLAARVGGIEAGVHYSASKAGLIGLTKTMAKEGAPYGVTVNVLAPGIIATGPVLKQIGDHRDDYNKTIPLGRLGKPEDVANAVLFFCSPLSDYITGITLDINGGLYMG